MFYNMLLARKKGGCERTVTGMFEIIDSQLIRTKYVFESGATKAFEKISCEFIVSVPQDSKSFDSLSISSAQDEA